MWAELVLVWGYVSVAGVSFCLGICECGKELVLVWGYVSVGGVSFCLGICECGRS